MPTSTGKIYLGSTLLTGGESAVSWKRNPAWLTIPTVGNTEQKFVGLIAVSPNGTFTALRAQGNYTVDWGDGTTENISSGVQANHFFDYTDSDLNNTNAPVTLTGSTDLVTRNNHGYSNGDVITLWNISGTTGISNGQQYYVINSTTNTFQISETSGGSAVALTGDGTATLLNYKQAIVVVTPQAGQNLTLLNINLRNSTSGLNQYEANWLDIELGSPNLTSLQISNSSTTNIYMKMLERVDIKSLGLITDLSSMFYNCTSLRSVSLLDTSDITNMYGLFIGCYSLESVPLFDTSSVTAMYNMFSDCYSLKSVPLFDTSSVTDMNNMFAYCYTLREVPLFNTSSVTDMNNMFNNCYTLKSVPLFDTSSVTNMDYMFSQCSSLHSIPTFNTSSVTTMVGMFQYSQALNAIPALNVSSVNSSDYFSGIFDGCKSISRIEAQDFNYSFSVENCRLSATALNEIYTNLPTVSGQTITVTGNYGTSSDTPSIATGKGWTVVG